MREDSLKKLDYEQVRTWVGAFCATALGRRVAEGLHPSTRMEAVARWLRQGRQAFDLMERFGPPPLGGVHDIAAMVRVCGEPTPLTGEELAKVAETCEATAGIRAWLRRIRECGGDNGTGSQAKAGSAGPGTSGAEALGDLAELVDRIGDFREVAFAIQEVVDGRGEVYDHASAKLRSIRRTIEEALKRIDHVFERLLSQPSVQRYLQYASRTFHDDRSVLPLRAEHRGRVPGIIHRTSDSGATLFVEPSEVVELNNSIIRLREEETAEIMRLLRELSRKVYKKAPELLDTLRAIALLDLNRGKWAYAKHYRCVYPELGDFLRLNGARHPILLRLFEDQARENGGPRREVVPIDVRLGEDFDALILTGPNTGGKTVTLKTVGLLALMAQSGLPIPAGPGSRVPIYRDIFVDIGDEQSLVQSLSTFSSHMANQLKIVEGSREGALVLLDELGAGTDPDEGAAIGRAVIEELLARKAGVIATTHLSALKAMAYTYDRVDNASVEFDVQTLQPTYRLLIGEPGESNAITIAARLGMPPRMVRRAKSHLSGRGQALNRAIKGTLESRRQAEEAKKLADQAMLDSLKAQEDFERKGRELERSREAHEQWMAWINTLQPGSRVYVQSARSHGAIVRMMLHKQQALVHVGIFDMEVPLRDLAEKT